MAIAKTADRYRDFILACLAQGPLPRDRINAPTPMLERMAREGYVRPKMHTTGCIATQYWYLPEHYPAPEPARLDCAVMDFAALIVVD